VYQEYDLFWNISRYNQDVRSSFSYCDNYNSQISSMAGVSGSHVRYQVISGRCQVITCQEIACRCQVVNIPSDSMSSNKHSRYHY